MLGHQPFKGWLLVSDMDGTLLNSKSELSAGNKAALDRFTAGGGLFTVATGRAEKPVLLHIDMLPLNVPAIIYNGACIYDFKAGRMLWQSPLPVGMSEPVKRVIERFPGIGVQVYHGGSAYFVTENQYTRAHAIREKFKPIIMEPENIPQPWFKIILAWDPPKLGEVEQFLKGFDIPFRQVYSEPQFLELLDKETSKGSALKILKRMLEPEKYHIVAMGDNMNDMELLSEADIGIAVGNAAEPLKAAADLCCRCHDLDAAAEVIGWIEEGRIAGRT
ncbi:MAG TPA: HAD family hydrolase [Clostridia bacterium]|nr:HAD family hydrolase [Clostridia bacterium]